MGVSVFHLHIIPLATFNFANAIVYSILHTLWYSVHYRSVRMYVEYFITVTLLHLHYVHLHVCIPAPVMTEAHPIAKQRPTEPPDH